MHNPYLLFFYYILYVMSIYICMTQYILTLSETTFTAQTKIPVIRAKIFDADDLVTEFQVPSQQYDVILNWFLPTTQSTVVVSTTFHHSSSLDASVDLTMIEIPPIAGAWQVRAIILNPDGVIYLKTDNISFNVLA